jgi:integration host factor subunit beta
MIKSELVECVIRAFPDLNSHDTEIAVDAALEAIADALANGNRVEIRGFGVFSARERRSRLGRNPRTGHGLAVPAKRVPKFTASKQIRSLLNPHGTRVSR